MREASKPRSGEMVGFWENHWKASAYEHEYGVNFYPDRQEEFAAIRQWLPKDGVVIEAGCAFGHVAAYFQTLGYRIVGLDYAEGALETGRACTRDLKLVQGDIHELPFKDGALAGYLSFGVLEHFESGPMAGLSEAYRVLRKGGVVAVTMPLPTPLVRDWVPRLRRWSRLRGLKRHSLIRRLFRKAPVLPEAPPAADHFYEMPFGPEQVRHFLEMAGFEVVRQDPIYRRYWFWLLGGCFRVAGGYHKPNDLADRFARMLSRICPWQTAFMSLAIGVKK